MKAGDKVFIYHSGGLSAVEGLARVVKGWARGSEESEVGGGDFEFLGRLEPVTLKEIKESGLFDDWALVRQGRLSTMEAPEKFVVWMWKKFPKAGI